MRVQIEVQTRVQTEGPQSVVCSPATRLATQSGRRSRDGVQAYSKRAAGTFLQGTSFIFQQLERSLPERRTCSATRRHHAARVHRVRTCSTGRRVDTLWISFTSSAGPSPLPSPRIASAARRSQPPAGNNHGSRGQPVSRRRFLCSDPFPAWCGTDTAPVLGTAVRLLKRDV